MKISPNIEDQGTDYVIRETAKDALHFFDARIVDHLDVESRELVKESLKVLAGSGYLDEATFQKLGKAGITKFSRVFKEPTDQERRSPTFPGDYGTFFSLLNVIDNAMGDERAKRKEDSLLELMRPDRVVYKRDDILGYESWYFGSLVIYVPTKDHDKIIRLPNGEVIVSTGIWKGSTHVGTLCDIKNPKEVVDSDIYLFLHRRPWPKIVK